MAITTHTEIQNSVPGGFQQVVYYKLSEKTSRGIPVLAIFLFLLSASVFLALALTIGKFDPSFTQGDFTIGIWEAGVGLAAIPSTIVVHGLAMRMFGSRPQYGVLPKHLAFYATAPGYAFRRNACIMVEIAPSVVLSVLAIMGMFLLQGAMLVPLLTVCAATYVFDLPNYRIHYPPGGWRYVSCPRY
jgi:hypothetical protein